MQLNTILLGAIAFLASSTYACKCVTGNKNFRHATRDCCAQQDGNFVSSGSDCAANSISEGLSEFLDCCQGFGHSSDCDFP